MEKIVTKYMCTFVNLKKGQSSLSKIISLNTDTKEMVFLDNNNKIYLDQILELGEIRETTTTIN